MPVILFYERLMDGVRGCLLEYWSIDREKLSGYVAVSFRFYAFFSNRPLLKFSILRLRVEYHFSFLKTIPGFYEEQKYTHMIHIDTGMSFFGLCPFQ
jgi:hypothetical protein